MTLKQIKRINRKLRIVQYDGPATMDIRIQHIDGAITTATYVLPDHLLAESVFEATCKEARELSAAAQRLERTGAYKQLRPYPLAKRSEK